MEISERVFKIFHDSLSCVIIVVDCHVRITLYPFILVLWKGQQEKCILLHKNHFFEQKKPFLIGFFPYIIYFCKVSISQLKPNTQPSWKNLYSYFSPLSVLFPCFRKRKWRYWIGFIQGWLHMSKIIIKKLYHGLSSARKLMKDIKSRIMMIIWIVLII